MCANIALFLENDLYLLTGSGKLALFSSILFALALLKWLLTMPFVLRGKWNNSNVNDMGGGVMMSNKKNNDLHTEQCQS